MDDSRGRAQRFVGIRTQSFVPPMYGRHVGEVRCSYCGAGFYCRDDPTWAVARLERHRLSCPRRATIPLRLPLMADGMDDADVERWRTLDAMSAEVRTLRVVRGQVLTADQSDDSTKGMMQAETLLEWIRERLGN